MVGKNRKLQVFVSSTFEDLKSERQTAVQAILTAGHIPAGMELFASGDESQLETIYRWIDASDVYLLILGGRYGSVEPNSQKSYTQLEFEYAIQKGKPHFSLVMSEAGLDERLSQSGKSVLELSKPQKWQDFRKTVLSKTSSFFDDSSEITVEILKSLRELQERHHSLVGWVKGDELELAHAMIETERLKSKLDASSIFGSGTRLPEIFSKLPDIEDAVEVRIWCPTPSGYGGEEVRFRSTWSVFFSFFEFSLSVRYSEWQGEDHYYIDEGVSRKELARELLCALQGYGVPDVEINSVDFQRLKDYYLEAGLLNEKTDAYSVTEIGKRLARRARINTMGCPPIECVSGNFPIKLEKDIPF